MTSYDFQGGRSAAKVWTAIHDHNCFQPTAAELAAARAAAAIAGKAARGATQEARGSGGATGGDGVTNPAAIVEESTFTGVCHHFLPAEQRV